MVAAYLRAEISSERFGDDVKSAMRAFAVDDSVITSPDIANSAENVLRADVLGAYRGYGQGREMFDGIPDELAWHEAELAREEIGDLRYVDYSYWNELTDHTRLVQDAVANIRRGKVVFDVPNDRFLDFAEGIRRGQRDFGPLILWAESASAPLEIIEGHLRATALALAGEKVQSVIPVLVGLAVAEA